MKQLHIFCAGLWLLLLTQHIAVAATSHPHRAQWIHFENTESRAAFQRAYQQHRNEIVSIPVYTQPEKAGPALGSLEISFVYRNNWIFEDVYFAQNGKKTYAGPGEHEAIGNVGYPFLKRHGNWFMLPPGPYPQSVWVELEPGPDGYHIRTTQFKPGAYMLGAPQCEAGQIPRKDCWPEIVHVIRNTVQGVYYHPDNTPNIRCITDTGASGPCRCTQSPCPSPKFLPWDKVFDQNGVSILDPQVGC